MSSGVQLQAVTNSGEKVAVKATADGYIYTTAVAAATGVFTSIAESLVIDEADKYWLIRDNGLVFTYINLDSLTSGTPFGKVIPASSDNSKELIEIFYDATSSGSSYSIGDILTSITLVDKIGGAIDSSFWINISTNQVISAPSAGSYIRHDTTQKITSVDLGVSTDSSATSDTGSFSLISLFKRLLTNTTTLLARVPSLGQALSASSVPVVLPAAQITALTPLSSVTVSNLPATQPVSGSVSVSNLPSTQAVSGTVTANAGTNLNTSALALESGGNLASINAKTPSLGQALAAASVPVVLPAAQLTALTPPTSVSVSNLPATQAISGSVSVSNLPATQAISGTVTANAGSNLNTSALALESGGNLDSINTKTPALGQALAGSSVPVVLPAAQITTLTPPTSVGVNNFPATQAVSGTITANAGTNLNTSALALESGGNLASINGKLPALGQALAAASVPVVLTSAQLTTLTPLSTVNVLSSNPTTIASGKKVVSTTASALTASALVNGIVITAAISNVAKIYVGPSGTTAANGYELAPGQSISYAVQNASAIYVIGANTTDYITYTGN